MEGEKEKENEIGLTVCLPTFENVPLPPQNIPDQLQFAV